MKARAITLLLLKLWSKLYPVLNTVIYHYLKSSRKSNKKNEPYILGRKESCYCLKTDHILM